MLAAVGSLAAGTGCAPSVTVVGIVLVVAERRRRAVVDKTAGALVTIVGTVRRRNDSGR